MNVKHSLGGNLVALNGCYHIGVLRQVSNTLGRNVFNHFDRQNLFFVLYKSSRVTDDCIKRNYRLLNHFNPGKINVSLYVLFIKINVSLATLDCIHKEGKEVVGTELAQKVVGKTIVHLFYFIVSHTLRHISLLLL